MVCHEGDKALVIAPHPDDEVLGCGGTLVHLADRGVEVHVVYVSTGEPDESKIEQRETEAKRAMQTLRVHEGHFMRIPERGLDVTLGNIRKISCTLKRIKPEVVFVPHRNEADRVHRIVNQITRESMLITYSDYEPDSSEKIALPVVLNYEVWTPMAEYHFISPISLYVERKREAMLAYESQMSIRDYASAILALSKYRGEINGAGEYAEVFSLSPVISIANKNDWYYPFKI